MRRRQGNPNKFMDQVQSHERTWGTDSYVGRPALGEIISASVVVFWKLEGKGERLVVSLHDDLSQLEAYFSKLLLRSQVTEARRVPVYIFQHQKRVVIRAVKVVFMLAPDQD